MPIDQSMTRLGGQKKEYWLESNYLATHCMSQKYTVLPLEK